MHNTGMNARTLLPGITLLALTATATATVAGAQAQAGVVAVSQQSGTTARLIAISAVSANIAWASGERGTFVRTIDGGDTWTPGQVAGAERLQFRDVHAVDERTAYLLSIGNGSDSRIYKTIDAGATWKLQFKNADSAAFYDCFDFFDAWRGVAVGDAVLGELAILTTVDGGEHWTRVAPRTLPPAMQGEGSFASSGTCIVAKHNGHAWFGTTKGRVLRSTDFGKTWKVSLTPVTVRKDSTGVTSVSFLDDRTGMAFGGYRALPGDTLVAFTSDGGASWIPRARPEFGPMYGGVYVQGALSPTVVAVGPQGSAYSRDHGVTWNSIDHLDYWGLGFAPSTATIGWAVGSNGRITKLTGF